VTIVICAIALIVANAMASHCVVCRPRKAILRCRSKTARSGAWRRCRRRQMARAGSSTARDHTIRMMRTPSCGPRVDGMIRNSDVAVGVIGLEAVGDGEGRRLEDGLISAVSAALAERARTSRRSPPSGAGCAPCNPTEETS
jgi:hypothetical protein